LLKTLRTEQPRSSTIAYYLGLTYKRLQDFHAARPHLEAAVVLHPQVKEAFVELVDLLYQSDQLKEAKKWITVARKESVSPAQLTFFEGLVLLKEGDDMEAAIDAFDEAEQLDESLSQTVTYYKGLAHVKLKHFGTAKDIFRQIVIKQPTTDLAEFADEYVDVISRREKDVRPFRANIGVALEYDDNVILKPNNEALAGSAGEEDDWRHVYTGRAEYRLKASERFGANAVYSFYGAKQVDLDFYDTLNHDISVQPAVYLENAAIAFPVHYNYVTLDDNKYLDVIGIGNLNNIMIGKQNMVQFSFQYNIKDYERAVTVQNDDRDTREYVGSAGWYYFFGKNNQGLLNVRYAMNYDDANGSNWRYFGNRLTASATVPVLKKLTWSIAADYFRQDFAKRNTTYDKDRYDNVVTVSNLLSYELFRDAELRLQHTFINDAASIGIYKYKRHVYSLGMKYNF
jgi:tetratricopeptide (TPR) repeat protein